MCHQCLGWYLLADAVLIIFFFCTLYLTKQLMASGVSQIVIFILCEHTDGGNGRANYPEYGEEEKNLVLFLLRAWKNAYR